MSEYTFLLDFMSYFQMLTLLDFGLVFIDKNSAVIKLQNRIIKEIQEASKTMLNKAGLITQKCRKDKFQNTEQGRKILGLAEMIRAEKTVFPEKTEMESKSMFMPAMGLTSGFFCLAYILLIPFFKKSGNISFLYFLEYIAESVYVSQIFILFTLFYKGRYHGFLQSMSISMVWFAIPFALATVMSLSDLTITFFCIDVYLIAFLILPLMPILTMIVRITEMIIDRKKRIKKIEDMTDELSVMLESYN